MTARVRIEIVENGGEAFVVEVTSRERLAALASALTAVAPYIRPEVERLAAQVRALFPGLFKGRNTP